MLKAVEQSKDAFFQARDEDLILLACTGQMKAFETLVKRYQTIVYTFAYRLTGKDDIAEEIAQDTFVQVYRQLKKFEKSRPFKPWILGIAANLARSHWRSANRKAQKEITSSDEAENQGSESGWDTIDLLERKLDAKRMLDAMTCLDSRYRAALLLRFKEELTYEESAEVLKIPVNTLRTWIRRGKETLRQIILKEQHDHDQ